MGDEKKRKKKITLVTFYICAGFTVFLMYVFGYLVWMDELNGHGVLRGFTEMKESLLSFHFFYPPSVKVLKGWVYAIIVGFVAFLLLYLDNERNYAYKAGASSGTGGFMTEEDLKEYTKKYVALEMNERRVPGTLLVPEHIETRPLTKKDLRHYHSENAILGIGVKRSMKDRLTRLNNNYLFTGASGVGKSRFVVKPNVLNLPLDTSFVITDPSAEILISTGKVLNDHGFRIKVFNIENMRYSNRYNPFAYIRDEAGVKSLIECFINNTTHGETGGDNQFFRDAEQLLYSACIFYLRDFCTDESKKNFASILNMINASAIDEQNANAKSDLDRIFDALPTSSLAWRFYHAFKQAAGKTLKSIIISCVTRLQPFMTPQVINLTKTDELDLESLAEEKTALFIITPQADRTYAFLASMLYTQLFDTLYHKGNAQKQKGGSERLKYSVRCIMDEFANIGEIPEFPSKLSTMRKYGIAAWVFLQDRSQTDVMYDKAAPGLYGNCDGWVFLGSSEPDTLKYFSEKLGSETIITRSRGSSDGSKSGTNKNFQETKHEVMNPEELGRLPNDECIIYTRGQRPIRAKKTIYEDHPMYPFTADADPANAFNFVDMPVYDNSRPADINSLLKAIMEAAKGNKEKDVSDPRKVSEMHTEKSSKEILNGFHMSSISGHVSYLGALAECRDKAAKDEKSPVTVIFIQHTPCDVVKRIEETIYNETGKVVIIFADNGERTMEGYIYGLDKAKTLNLSFSAPYCKGAMRRDGDYAFVVIRSDDFSSYRSFILDQLGIKPESEIDPDIPAPESAPPEDGRKMKNSGGYSAGSERMDGKEEPAGSVLTEEEMDGPEPEDVSESGDSGNEGFDPKVDEDPAFTAGDLDPNMDSFDMGGNMEDPADFS